MVSKISFFPFGADTLTFRAELQKLVQTLGVISASLLMPKYRSKSA